MPVAAEEVVGAVRRFKKPQVRAVVGWGGPGGRGVGSECREGLELLIRDPDRSEPNNRFQ